MTLSDHQTGGWHADEPRRGTTQYRLKGSRTGGGGTSLRTTRVLAGGLPRELLHLLDHDPRFRVTTLDGRWVEPFAGKAVLTPSGLRPAAITFLQGLSDWHSRPILGMDRLNQRRWRLDIDRLVALDERFRIIDARSGSWVNPYTGLPVAGCQVQGRPLSGPVLDELARICANCHQAAGHPMALDDLLKPGRAVVGIDGAYEQPSARTRTPRPTRRASSVFRPLPQEAGWEFGVHATSHLEVGGDFYEITRQPDGRLLVLLGDVSGHGMSGALAAAGLLKSLRLSHGRFDDLTALARHLNAEACADLPSGRFITAWMALIDPSNGHGCSLSCGHHRPLLLDPRGPALATAIGKPSMALGLRDGEAFDARLSMESFVIPTGAWLVQCSDGVIEAHPQGGELYGLSRYAGNALALCDDGPQALCDGLAASARAFAGGDLDDDCTVVALRRVATPVL